MVKIKKIIIFSLGILGCLGQTVEASPPPQVQVLEPWARPAQMGQNGAVFMLLKSAVDDQLIKVECADCKTVELHTHITETVQDKEGQKVDIKKMRPVPFIPLKAEKITELKKGGLHIMLMGMKRTLKEGDPITLKLLFQKAPPLEIVAVVKKSCGCH